MKVIQIIENEATGLKDSSALGLRNSFNREQWNKIVCYFMKTAKENPQGSVISSVIDFFIDDSTVNSGTLDAIHRKVGMLMPTGLTPSGWQSFAQQFGMQVPNVTTSISWQAIYNHLAQHSDYDCDMEVRAPGEYLGVNNDSLPDTEETRQGFIRLISAAEGYQDIPNSLETQEQIDALFKLGVVAVANTPHRNRDQFPDDAGDNRTWRDVVQNTEMATQLGYAKLERLSQMLQQNGSVSKEEVIEQLWQFVITVDQQISTRRRNPPEQQ